MVWCESGFVIVQPKQVNDPAAAFSRVTKPVSSAAVISCFLAFKYISSLPFHQMLMELLEEQCTLCSQEHLWDQRWDCWLLAPSEHGELSCTWRACSRKKQMHLPSQMEHMPRDKCNSVGSINRKVGVETLCL